MSDLPPPPPGHPPYPPTSGNTPDVGQSFTWAWNRFKDNAAPLVLSSLVVYAIVLVLYLVIYIPFLTGAGDVTVDEQTGQISTGGPGFLKLILVLAIAVFLISLVVGTLGSNLTRMGLKLADGQTITVRDLFTFPRGAATVVTAFLVGLGTGLGLLLCYFPGIVFGIGAGFTYHLFYDRELAPVEAIKASFRLVKDNLGATLVALILGALISAAGVIACGVGVLVSGPVGMLFIVHQYRVISGGTVTAG